MFFINAGFGDAVNNSECWLPVAKYIEDQFDLFLEAEQRVHRFEQCDKKNTPSFRSRIRTTKIL